MEQLLIHFSQAPAPLHFFHRSSGCIYGNSVFSFVDIFEYIDFDLSKSQGGGIVTNLNGRPAQYMENLHNGDRIEIYWRKLLPVLLPTGLPPVLLPPADTLPAAI